VPDGFVRLVRQHQIRRPADGVQHLLIHARIGEVGLNQRRAGNRLDHQQVHARHRRRAAIQRHLHPAARRRAQVDDPRAALDQAELVVDLHQLEGGAAAPALGPRAVGPFVRQLSLDPRLAGQGLLVGRLDLLADLAARGCSARRQTHHAAAFLRLVGGLFVFTHASHIALTAFSRYDPRTIPARITSRSARWPTKP